jgi:pimeloyl-ACP methyl ester carboxylesterase
MRSLWIITAFLATLVAGPAQAGAGRVYLLRGLANVFSTGMDTLAYELKARGFDAEVYSYGSAEGLASEAAALQKSGKGPIIIVGHSLGADYAFNMARAMKQLGAPVALIVAFGPTYSEKAPSNVSRVINYYQQHSIVQGTISRDSGFRGSLSNINLDSSAGITHFNIDKSEQLHAQTIEAIQSIAGRRKAAATPAAAQAER